MLGNTELMLGDADSAYRNLLVLEQQLRDGQTIKLDRNQGDWFFHIGDGETVSLSSDAAKTTYARYLIALSALLSSRAAESERYLAQTRSPASDGASLGRVNK